ncbi:MAG: methyltransferase domain-containing protein [Isosphaeraceae bacterium]
MARAMDPLPTNPNDPRLDGWYHTMELAPGVITKGTWDLRPTADLVGIPSSLKGMTALDVGTANGFWAFEMERRGADRVVAIDVADDGGADILPRWRAQRPPEEFLDTYRQDRFLTAHAMLKSHVDYRFLNVYDLSPDSIGGLFDVVYCGSLLLHLRDPLKALINMRSVCKGIAVVETCSFHPDPIEETHDDKPYMYFGRVAWEGAELGRDVGYWSFTQRALCDMLLYAGFSWVEPLAPFQMQRGGINASIRSVPVVAHVKPNPEVQGFIRRQARIDQAESPPTPVSHRPMWRRVLSAIRNPD